MLTSASLGADALWHVVDQLALLKRFVAEMAAQWNGHLLDIVAAKKKEDKVPPCVHPVRRSEEPEEAHLEDLQLRT